MSENGSILKNDFFEFIDNARKKRPEKLRHHFYIFLTCLVISVFFWFLVQLSKEYSYNVEYRLNYRQIPFGYRLTGSSDSLLIVTVKVQGFEFFSEHFFRARQREITVSLRGIKVKTASEKYFGFLLTRNLSGTVISESDHPLVITSTSPDTLFFTFEKKNPKRIPTDKTNSGNQPKEKEDVKSSSSYKDHDISSKSEKKRD